MEGYEQDSQKNSKEAGWKCLDHVPISWECHFNTKTILVMQNDYVGHFTVHYSDHNLQYMLHWIHTSAAVSLYWNADFSLINVSFFWIDFSLKTREELDEM